MKPLRESGRSANLTYYSEPCPPGPEPDGRVWTSVLTDTLRRDEKTGEVRFDGRPVFHGTVYRTGEGEVATFFYAPKTKPSNGVLPERTVTKLVREALSA